jgi:hypothetical protein
MRVDISANLEQGNQYGIMKSLDFYGGHHHHHYPQYLIDRGRDPTGRRRNKMNKSALSVITIRIEELK